MTGEAEVGGLDCLDYSGAACHTYCSTTAKTQTPPLNPPSVSYIVPLQPLLRSLQQPDSQPEINPTHFLCCQCEAASVTW